MLVLTDDQPDMDALNWKVHKVHTDMDFVRTSMGGELSKVHQGLQDARVTADNHETELAQLWRASKQAEAELRELNRLVETVGSKLHSMVSETKADTSRLQESLARSLDEGHLAVEGRLQELHKLVSAGDLEQGRAMKQAVQEAQAWQANAELRLASITDALARARTEASMSTQALREELRRSFEEVQERDLLAQASHKGVQDSLHSEARSLAEKQAHCASELHRLVRGLGTQVNEGHEQQLALERALARTGGEFAEQQKALAEELHLALAQMKQEAGDSRETLRIRMDEQISVLDERVCRHGEDCRAWRPALAEAEGRLAKEDRLMRDLLEAEIAKCRSWSSERLQEEVSKLSKQIAEVSTQIAPLDARVASEEERSAALSKALGEAEARLSKEDAAAREKLAELTTALSRAEARLSNEDALTREQLSAVSSTLEKTEAHLRGEDALTREQIDSLSAEQARSHREFSKRLEALGAQLAGAESRLAGEDSTTRERLDGVSATLKGTDQRLSSEGLEVRKQVDQLSSSIAAGEAALRRETAVLRERLDGLQEAITAAEGRLTREDNAARERVESLAVNMTNVENRLSMCDAATRQRVEALATEQASAEARINRDVAARSRQLDSLGAHVVGMENKLLSEDAFLRARVEALTTTFDGAEARRSSEESVTRERLEGLATGLASAEGRLGRDGAVQRDRLEQLSAALSTAESRFGGEHATAQKKLEALGKLLASHENKSGTELTALHERLEALGSTLAAVESRMATEDAALRERTEERIKEEVSWMVSLVKPIQQSIDKLAWGFHDLGCSHVRCAREFEVLEQVVKDVEIRVLPWRSGLDGDTLRYARLVQPPTARSLQDASVTPSRPRSIMDGMPGGGKMLTNSPLPPSGVYTPPAVSPIVGRQRGPRRPASARPGSGLAMRLVAESEQRPASALDLQPLMAEHVHRPGTAMLARAACIGPPTPL